MTTMMMTIICKACVKYSGEWVGRGKYQDCSCASVCSCRRYYLLPLRICRRLQVYSSMNTFVDSSSCSCTCRRRIYVYVCVYRSVSATCICIFSRADLHFLEITLYLCRSHTLEVSVLPSSHLTTTSVTWASSNCRQT